MPRAKTTTTRYRALSREHGTERGYQQHYYRREHACEPCRLAHLAHTEPSRAERSARRAAARAASDGAS